jgi:3,4-dihydroxy 2-butanone 4-phosphate synthase
MLDDDSGEALSKEKSKDYGKEHGLIFLEGKEIVEAYTLWTGSEC